MHLWIGWWRNMRYPQKFKIFGSYPFLHDSSDRGWPTRIATIQVLDISAESEVIHKNSGDLLLPTIFIKNEKEQDKGKPGRRGWPFVESDKCLSNIEKFFSAAVTPRCPHPDTCHARKSDGIASTAQVVLVPKLMHRKLYTGVEGQQPDS
mgnify:FL=1